MTDAARDVGMRAALERAQKLIEREFPNGQLAIDIRAVLAIHGAQPSPAMQVIQDAHEHLKAGIAAVSLHGQVPIELHKAAHALSYALFDAPPQSSEKIKSAMDVIDRQLDGMHSLKGWRMTLIRKNMAKLRAAMDGAGASPWQTIDTAPDDFGTQVWGWDDKRGSNPMILCETGWRITYDDALIQPTHWMPLPTSPHSRPDRGR